MTATTSRRNHFYGRHAARSLTVAKKNALENIGAWEIALPEKPVDNLAVFFDKPYPRYILEIGFGGGEHLLALALRNPDAGIIGIEPYEGGVAKVAAKLQQHPIENLRLLREPAQLFLPLLPKHSLAAIYVLFPDPWPKTKHHKRRLVTADFCRQAKELLLRDGNLYLASDVPEYQHQMLVSAGQAGWQWTALSKADWETPFTDGIITGYQRRAIAAGRRPAFLHFR
jgi:tRNA (guanine-N7-)-methyltransferase